MAIFIAIISHTKGFASLSMHMTALLRACRTYNCHGIHVHLVYIHVYYFWFVHHWKYNRNTQAQFKKVYSTACWGAATYSSIIQFLNTAADFSVSQL